MPLLRLLDRMEHRLRIFLAPLSGLAKATALSQEVASERGWRGFYSGASSYGGVR